nr:MAG TPA_asm: hypothetical protein [Caudoviricetes sp.]DAP91905.1 MAG TPA: hypothetical protein [Caudoviricetes sp.]
MTHDLFPFRREPVARQSRRKLTVCPGSQLKDFLRCARAMRIKKPRDGGYCLNIRVLFRLNPG